MEIFRHKHFKMILSVALCSILVLSCIFDANFGKPFVVAAETAVTETNPISFSLTASQDPPGTMTNKYTINVNSVFDDGSITYKTVFITYPNTLKLIQTSTLPTGFSMNINDTTGTATLAIIDDTKPGLSPAVVKSTLESFYFGLKDAKVSPKEGALVAISANRNRIAFNEDERGYLHYYQFIPGSYNWMTAYNDAKSRTMTDPFTGKVLNGYLATITSEDEQRMIFNAIAKVMGWLGGTRMVYSNKSKISDTKTIPTTGYITTDTNVANAWYWANGPEAWTSPTGQEKPTYKYEPEGTGSPLIFWNSALFSTNPYPVPGVYACFDNKECTSILTGAKGGGNEPNSPGEFCLIFAWNNKDTWNDIKSADLLGYYLEFGGYQGDPNTNDMKNALENTAVPLPMPVAVEYRSVDPINGNYKEMIGIGTSSDYTLYGSLNDPYTVTPLPIAPEGYIFSGYDFVGASTDASTVQIDAAGKVQGKMSAYNQKIVMLYELQEDVFSVTLNPTIEKTTKPGWAPTAASVRSNGLVKEEDIVQFIMLPVSDTSIITTEDQFNQIAATLDAKYKGQMHQTESGRYNMYSLNDPNLNGVLDNCTLWIMAKGTNQVDGSTVVAFDTYKYKNIYTPIDVFYKGETTSDTALYAKLRVGMDGNTEAIYGIPLDLDGTVITDPPFGYDEIQVVHDDLEPLWTFDPAPQQDVAPLILNDVSLDHKVYSFKYDKHTSNWFDATFQFEDDAPTPTTLRPSEVVTDFVPNDNGEKTYMLSKDLYIPEPIPGYDPIGYKIDGGSIVYTSFPLKYGAIVLTSDNQTVTIVYRPVEQKVVEKYYLYETDENGNEVFKEEIIGFLPSVTSVTSDSAFNIKAPALYGYVYKGYSTDGGSTFSNDDSPAPLDITSDTTIIYKYKLDTTLTGIADEDVKRITVSGVGMDAHGNVEATLYTITLNATYDTTFTPEPKGDDIGNGTIAYKVVAPSQWILSKDPDLYSVTPFVVKGNAAIKFYYFKDTSGNGIPDYLEANITLKYTNEANGQSLLDDYLITEYAPDESFTRKAPTIPKYIAVGVLINKEGETSGTPVYTEGEVTGNIPLLGVHNWMMEFLYQPDTNDNGIPDNKEASITVKAVYTYADGHQETTQVGYLGLEGERLQISAATVNQDASKFEYVGGMTGPEATYAFSAATPQVITLYFKEKGSVDPTNKSSSSHGSGGSGIVIPEKPSTVPSTAPSSAPSSSSKGSQSSGRNQYTWATFEKPETIFLDGALIPLSGLIFNGPYIVGYPDQTIGPDRNLTRAEAAQIIYNLYGKPDQFVHPEENLPYKDVANDAWYAKAVAFLTEYKMIVGYPDGLFYPNKPITRAELVTLLVQYQNIATDTANETIFEDVAHHWAKAQINAAYNDHIISGFPDGTFKPNDLATRSEAVTIINTMLQRPDRWIGEDEYTDLTTQDWAYSKLMNAANGYFED